MNTKPWTVTTEVGEGHTTAAEIVREALWRLRREWGEGAAITVEGDGLWESLNELLSTWQLPEGYEEALKHGIALELAAH
jgi:hypothetical protein